jgi:hypothetical protein
MQTYSLKPITLFVILVAATSITASGAQQGQRQGTHDSATGACGTVQSTAEVFDLASVPSMSPDEATRLAKAKRYDEGKVDLTTLRPGEVLIDQYWPRIEVMPVSGSASVIVGVVLGLQAYLSNDRSRIYTEITVRIEEVLKSDKGNMIGTVILDKLGGALHMKEGRIVRDPLHICYLGNVRCGARYVFFAKKTHDGMDLEMQKAYELRGGEVYELTDDGGPGTQLLGGGAEALSNERIFLATVRKCVVRQRDAPGQACSPGE